MARLAFNSTADIYYGPGTATPGILKATVACRLVIEDGIFLAGVGAPLRVAYLTHDGGAMDDSFVHAYFGADSRLADQVAIPSGGAVGWWILFEEEVLWRTQPAYWRSNLIQLPLPGPPPPCICPAVSRVIIGSEIPSGIYSRVIIGGGDLAAEGRVIVGSLIAHAERSRIIIGGVDCARARVIIGGGELAAEGRVIIRSEIDTEPGPTCADALELELGEDFTFTSSTINNQWYRVPVTIGVLLHLRADTLPGGVSLGVLLEGSNCASQFGRGFIEDTNLCIDGTSITNGYWWFQVFPQASAFSYTFRFDVGTC